jgi:hypothetical protein
VRKYKREWRGVFNAHNELIAVCEWFPDGWHIYANRRFIGTVANPSAAKERMYRDESLEDEGRS